MGYVLLIFVIVFCLIGGLFYGMSYIRAKATGKGVSETIFKSLDDLTKKPSA